MLNIQFKQLNKNAKIPKKGNKFDACFDLYSTNETNVAIMPHQTVFFSLGFATSIPEGWCAKIYARSGMACKNGLRLANDVGIIDSEYREEWQVALHNDSDEIRTIEPYTRIAQVSFEPIYDVTFTIEEFLDETDRGEGFGSSGEH